MTLSAAQGTTSTVAYTLAGTGGATLGTDTTAQPVTGTLTFAPGVVTQTIVIAATFDTLVEIGEGVSLTLSAPSTGTVLSTTAATTTIALLDPVAPTFTLTSNAIAGAATTEGNTITYTITPSSVTDKAYTFTLSTQGDTIGGVAGLASGPDFSPAASTVTFAAGTTTAQTVIQTVVADGITEGLEGYKTTLLNSSLTAVGSISGLINDGSVAGTVGTTFLLTTVIDNVVGTAADDVIIGDALTLSATDVINGGAGIDTLSYTNGSAGALPIPAATVSNVEVINERNVNTGTGVTESSVVNFSGLLAGQSVTVAGLTLTLSGGAAAVASTAVATAFASLTVGATIGGTVTNGSYTGTFTGFSTGTATASAVTATSATISANVPDITVSAVGAVAPTTVTTQGASGALDTINAANFVGATNFNSVNSLSPVAFTNLAAATQSGGVAGNGSTVNAATSFAFTSGTVATLNISGGTTTGFVTETGATLTSAIVNSTGAANTLGGLTLAATNTALTINAATNLTTGTITGFTGTAPSITATGAATAVNIGTLDSAVTTVNASGMTAGGITFTATTTLNPALAFVGGQGNDSVTVGATALTTGSIAAGAGTGDRLTVSGSSTAVATATDGAKFSGFEVLGAANTVTVDMNNLAANNTFTSLVLGAGTNVINNVNAVAGTSVLVTASGTDTINILGATVPGTINTMAMTVSDGLAAVNTIMLTTPSIAGVENLNLTATDNIVITSLGNATALINIGVVGAGTVNITTSAMALQTNFAVSAGTATGNLTFDGTGATVNGFSVTGSSGVNTITGGSQVFTANLTASAAKADVILLTNATGGTLALPNATITGFTNSATLTVGDKLDLVSTPVLNVAVTAAASSTDTTVIAALSAAGILTFSGTGAAAASLATKIAIASEGAYGGGVQYNTSAFEHAGNTYIVEAGTAAAGYAAGTDFVVQLTGVTGVTALSTTASAATTVFIA